MIEEVKKSISDRERKYRLRDTEKKEWYGQSDNNILTWYGFSIFGECTLMSGMPSLSYLPNLIQSDYTGLKDKNGKEIYEGDIVHFSQYKKNAIVVYEDCKYVLYRTDSDRPRHIPKYTDLYCREGEIEVIGNIYENEDLLS